TKAMQCLSSRARIGRVDDAHGSSLNDLNIRHSGPEPFRSAVLPKSKIMQRRFGVPLGLGMMGPQRIAHPVWGEI
ncbi:MAG: hypothetical protein V3R51_05560, partial [Gammaproteobacteria bacterium]